MTFKDAVELYFERSNAMQTFWNFYLTIILALIAFFASSTPSRQLRRVAIILTVGFVAFAIVNGSALRNVTEQRVAIAEAIQKDELLELPAADLRDRIKRTIDPPSVVGVIGMHIVGDVVLIAAIWLLATRSAS